MYHGCACSFFVSAFICVGLFDSASCFRHGTGVATGSGGALGNGTEFGVEYGAGAAIGSGNGVEVEAPLEM